MIEARVAQNKIIQLMFFLMRNIWRDLIIPKSTVSYDFQIFVAIVYVQPNNNTCRLSSTSAQVD